MRRRLLAALLGAGVLVATVVGVVAANRQPGAADVVVADAAVEIRGSGDATAIVPAVEHPFRAGQAVVPEVRAFAAPGPAAGEAPAFTSTNPTHEGFPLVVSVIDETDDGEWLHVRFPQRPNGTSGWIRADQVSSWGLRNAVEVSLAERVLRVRDGTSGDVLFEASVSVGSDATPTPVGEFFIDIVNPLGAHPTYGWGQLSVSGFSDVLERFAGGIGQIAIHGWNDPSAMGRNVSNGCVRMNNDDIARVAELAPLGTPVTITA
jgi:lipoprotein-anchoring transpeptidase ErfK/SrfK